MIIDKIDTIVLFLGLIAYVTTVEYSKKGNLLSGADSQAKDYFNKILKSLVNLNEERMKSLKKTYSLNEHDLVKNTLRNRPDDYEEIIKSINLILKDLKHTNGISNGLPEYFRTKHYYFINKNKPKPNAEPYLRGLSNEINNKQSDDVNSKDDSEEDKDNSKDVDSDKEKRLRYNYYYSYSCDRPRIRCKRACNDSYKLACYYWKECSDRFRVEMRRSCRRACSSRFYDGYTK